MSSSTSATNATQSNRGTNGNNNRTKKSEFKGKVEGFSSVALLPEERRRGTPANFKSFISDLANYTGREIGESTAKLWGVACVRHWEDGWQPSMPVKPEKSGDEVKDLQATIHYEKALKDYSDAIGSDWDAVRLQIWCTIEDQCSPRLRGHLEKLDFYDGAASTHDVCKLLQHVNVLVGGGKILGWEPRAQQKALTSLFRFQQQQLTLSEYFNEFKAKYGTVKALGGNLQTKQYDWIGGDGTTVKSDEAVLVCIFLAGANQQEYGDCLQSLDNDAATKTIRYPATLEDAYTLLDEYVQAPKKKNSPNPNSNNDDVRSYLDIDPSLPENEICLTSTKYEWMIDAFWILLDTASTVTIFCNAIFLSKIRQAQRPTIIHTSGGELVATLEGYLPFLQRWVAYHPDCLGNILSFRDVLDAHHVTFNSRQSRKFTVHCLRGGRGRTKTKVHFRPSGTGLYFFDTDSDLSDKF